MSKIRGLFSFVFALTMVASAGVLPQSIARADAARVKQTLVGNTEFWVTVTETPGVVTAVVASPTSTSVWTLIRGQEIRIVEAATVGSNPLYAGAGLVVTLGRTSDSTIFTVSGGGASATTSARLLATDIATQQTFYATLASLEDDAMALQQVGHWTQRSGSIAASMAFAHATGHYADTVIVSGRRPPSSDLASVEKSSGHFSSLHYTAKDAFDLAVASGQTPAAAAEQFWANIWED